MGPRDLTLFEPRPEDDRESDEEREAREEAEADLGDMIADQEREDEQVDQ
jgi:hypothetical protein